MKETLREEDAGEHAINFWHSVGKDTWSKQNSGSSDSVSTRASCRLAFCLTRARCMLTVALLQWGKAVSRLERGHMFTVFPSLSWPVATPQQEFDPSLASGHRAINQLVQFLKVVERTGQYRSLSTRRLSATMCNRKCGTAEEPQRLQNMSGQWRTTRHLSLLVQSYRHIETSKRGFIQHTASPKKLGWTIGERILHLNSIERCI